MQEANEVENMVKPRCEERMCGVWRLHAALRLPNSQPCAARTAVLFSLSSSYRHFHSTIGADNTASRPTSLCRTQHSHNARDLIGEARPLPSHTFLDDFVVFSWISTRSSTDLVVPFICHKWCRINILLINVPELLPCLGVHISPYGSGVDAVDGAILRELTRPHSRHSLHCGFRACVD